MKLVTIIGVGMGPDTMTQEGVRALQEAELLFGAPRLLTLAPADIPSVPVYTAGNIQPVLDESACTRFAVLVSGDTGFYSAASQLHRSLQGCEVRVLPGISSLNCFFARLGRSWQDAALISCHGRETNIVEYVRRNRETFALTGGNAAELAQALCRAGFGALPIWTGEQLGTAQERVTGGIVSDLTARETDPLSVLLVENPAPDARTPTGIPDGAFIRGDVPMTKSAVRAVVMSRLALSPDAVCCDIGAGTGSVTVEMALSAWRGRVYAIDKNREAVGLIRRNCDAFHVGNVTVLCGDAAAEFEALPPMDAVFIGGSGGGMAALVRTAVRRNPRVRIVATAIALESVHAAMEAFSACGLTPEALQISVACTRPAGRLHLLTAQNPIFTISGGGNHE